MRVPFLILALGFISTAASAQPPDRIACAGPFGRDSSHARLVAAFGADHVTFETLDGPESSERQASVLFGKDPARRIEIEWHDTTARARPSVIQVEAPATVAGPGGVRIGARLAEVARLNGRPFKISGFGWDNAGLTAFGRGKLRRLHGGCAVGVRFQPSVGLPLGVRFRPITGNREIAATHPLMRAAKPVVVTYFVSYPR